MNTEKRDMMTDSPANVLRCEIRAWGLPGAWTVGENGWDGAVVLQHPTRSQGRVYTLAEAKAHVAKHA